MARVKRERVVNKCQTTTLLDMEFSNMTETTRKVCRSFINENLEYLRAKEDLDMDEISFSAKLSRKLKGLNDFEKTMRNKKDWTVGKW